MEATLRTSLQPPEPGKNTAKGTYYRRRRARMTPEQIEAFNARVAFNARERRRRDPQRARALARAKYWRRVARDPEGFRASRRAIDSGYQPGVYVELVFPPE
jgi:hypothetical protein